MMRENLIDKSNSFIRKCYFELGKSVEDTEYRISEVNESIIRTGTYTQTTEELIFGARAAWRNNSRCIGRLFWKSLEVFDERELDCEEEVAEALFRHISFCTNSGRIKPIITIFTPTTESITIRIWNHQLIRYAGYETSNGVIGDPASIEFTKQCIALGWKGEGTEFDVLPLVIQLNDNKPKMFEIPKNIVLEVPILHPHIQVFKDMNLKWYAVPIVSDMTLEIGGLIYTAAPFNGWYMLTEIATRNLADTNRYNKLREIAQLLELDTSTNISLWKDKALVELNEAVLYSFRSQNVSIVDHHTACEQFLLFEKQEVKAGREVNARWSWLIPPMSPATTEIWHNSYNEFNISPNFSYQDAPFQAISLNKKRCPMHQ